MGELDDFLAGAATTRNCVVCGMPRIADILVDYLDRLQAGTTTCSANKLHNELLVGLGGPRSLNTILGHIRGCLKRDPKTGFPLDSRRS